MSEQYFENDEYIENFNLTTLRSLIPPHCFQKKTSLSMFYLLRDIMLLSTCFFTYDFFQASWIGLFFYWNIYGFLMWCLFVIGHDCGHGLFSKYPLINAICGHICHTPLFVPFFPWAYSHKKHHLFSNHVEKDHSYHWYTIEEYKKLHFIKKKIIRHILTPFYGFSFYLLFGHDGSHINPFGRLFLNAPNIEKIKCIISIFSLILFGSILYVLSPNFLEFVKFYLGCWTFFCFWLFIVTYMQHHEENTLVYDNSSWSFLKGVLQTVDRSYGFGIDDFHHNVTDCHLVHHLFFNQIPHYHLKDATKSIKPALGNKYRYVKHRFFLKDFWKMFFKLNLTKWILVSKNKNTPQT
jgi:omega-3 fatty acid desaturase (delta-15 desaturase)